MLLGTVMESEVPLLFVQDVYEFKVLASYVGAMLVILMAAGAHAQHARGENVVAGRVGCCCLIPRRIPPLSNDNVGGRSGAFVGCLALLPSLRLNLRS